MRTKLGILMTSALLATTVSAARPPAAPVAAAVAAPAAIPAAAPPHGKGKFLGAHPLAGRLNAGYCYIDVPHVHDYLPDRPGLYQQTGDSYVFNGDPVPFGYDGDKTVFYGHHPIPLAVEPAGTAPSPTFCFLKGPHYHDYPRPEEPGFKVKDNVVFYVGAIPPEVAVARPQLERVQDAEFRPYTALRPQVVVAPPPEWQGVVWVPPPPTPVVVAPPAPAVVVAPNPTVVVAPPAPIVVAPPVPTVVIGAPAPVFFYGKGKGKGWKGGHGWGHFGGGKGHWKH